MTHYIDPRPGWITDRTYELHESGLSYDAARTQAEAEAEAEADEKFGTEDNGDNGNGNGETGMSATQTQISPDGRIQLLTISDVMAALKIGRTGVYQLFNTGKLGWVQVGAHRRVTHAQMERFIAAHSRSGTGV